jgi:hypothetical protein
VISLRGTVSEDMVVAAFLLGDADGRFRTTVLEIAARLEVSEEMIRDVEGDAAAKRRVLAEHRGWPDRDLCEGMPRDIVWHRAQLDLEDLRTRVFYIEYYWEEFSGGTRSPAMVAERLASAADRSIYGEIVDALAAGVRPAPPILVSRPELDRLVILEGHARVTAYLLAPQLAPLPLDALVGISPAVGEWNQW